MTGNSAGIVFKEREIGIKKVNFWHRLIKGKKMLGYNPNTDFRQGLLSVHDWFRENWSNILSSSEFDVNSNHKINL